MGQGDATADGQAESTIGEVELDGAVAAARHKLFGARGRPVRVGRYTVLEPIGRGGMGAVFAAHDPELDRTVALKLVGRRLRGDRSSASARARWLREGQAIAKLSHPNVIEVYDVGEQDGQAFIAMEHVEGESLAAWLRRSEHSLTEILEVFERAGRGLEAAHSAGIVHRDFKPDNVLVAPGDVVKVVDFGIARVTTDSADESDESDGHASAGPPDPAPESLTRTGVVWGTPAYMAPEQHTGAAADARSDQFGFCVALFEAVYGVRPFGGDTPAAIRERAQTGEVQIPARARRVPAWLRDTILRGLNAKPGDRFASMSALLAALTRARSHRRRAWGLLGLATVGAGSAGLALTIGDPEPCRTAPERLGGVWDDSRKAVVEAAFSVSSVPYAHQTWGRVEASLDAYASAWVGQHTDACEATHVRGQQSTEVLDRRMSCLGRRLEEFAALVDVFAEADATTVERAALAASRLDPVFLCAHLGTLAAGPAAPPDLATARRVEAVRDELARVRALRESGRYAHGLSAAAAALEVASQLDYEPVRAEALFAKGGLETSSGAYTRATESLTDAYFSARANEHVEVAAGAATALVHVLGRELARPDDALGWARLAEVEVGRLGSGGLHAAALRRSIGNVLHLRGRFEDALAQHRANLEIVERVYGSDHPGAAAAHDAIGSALTSLGRYAQATGEYREAIAIWENGVGADHPNVGAYLDNLAQAELRDGRFGDALEHSRLALSLRERSLGAGHPKLGISHNNVGNAFLRQGRHRDALAHYRRARVVWEATLGPEHPNVAAAITNVGIVLGEIGRHAQAAELHRRALEIRARSLGPEHTESASARGNLALELHYSGRSGEALTYAEHALAIRERELGALHEHVANALSTLGRVHGGLGHGHTAVRYLERALAVSERTMGPEHFKTVGFRAGLGERLLGIDRVPEATAVLERAAANHEELLGDPRGLAVVRFNLARALWRGGQRARARELAALARDGLASLGEAGDAPKAKVDAWLRSR